MKRFYLAPLILLLSFCSSGRGTSQSSSPGHGAITVAVIPNPIVVQRVSGDTYEFPFDVVINETGGRPVSITRVTATVTALGAIPVGSETYDAAKINALGYPTRVPARGEIRIHISQRRNVSDERLFSAVSSELRVDAVDDQGFATSASTTVTVRR
jgi:hypothetical protein